jgi:hypothetical protein
MNDSLSHALNSGHFHGGTDYRIGGGGITPIKGGGNMGVFQLGNEDRRWGEAKQRKHPPELFIRDFVKRRSGVRPKKADSEHQVVFVFHDHSIPTLLFDL